MAALEYWRGALLVEPVGSGKSWIALAAARPTDTVVVVGPALLRGQWEEAARSAGVGILYWSTERLSRGTLPASTPSLVIIDEAHRFRNASTRRVRTLAPFLVGRRVLLLTATPIVNRLHELVTLLRLCLPEDALRHDGIAQLGDLMQCDLPPIALRRVVIRSGEQTPITIAASARRLGSTSDESDRGTRAVALIHQLTTRHRAAAARLLAVVLLDAAASSDAALLQALRRYRAMLRQARDAGGSDRATLRRFAGEELDQLVWWELVGVPAGGIALPVDDLPLVEQLVDAFIPADSPWLAALRVFLTEGPPVVCFTRHRATATLLRTTIGDGTAWVTGDSAGIGPHRLPREAVLDAFGPARDTWSLRRTRPRCLVATDVAAEGLNLQGAGRLVHIDVPWTAMRVAQREGRLLRIGQQHEEVEILLREPPPPIEDALRRATTVARKGSLASRSLDRLGWSDRRADPPPDGTLYITAAITADAPARDLVIVEVTDHATGRVGEMVLERAVDAPWELAWCDPEALWCATIEHSLAAPYAEVETTVESAIRAAHQRLRRTGGWAPPRLVTRIHRLARVAAWQRNVPAIQRLDATLHWCHSAPTLGQRLVVERLAAATDGELVRFAAPAASASGPVALRVVGVLLFRSAERPLRSGHAFLPDHPLRSRRDTD